MKKTIGWAAVGQDGEIAAGDYGFGRFEIFADKGPGLVRVKIIAYPEKKRKTRRNK